MNTTTRSIAFVAAALTCTLSACSKDPDDSGMFTPETSTTGNATGITPGSDTDDGTGDGMTTEGDTDGDDTVDPDPVDEPHARATIVIGENSASATSTPVPYITAAFDPDYVGMEAARCGAEIDGCFVSASPVCETACEFGETCAYDDSCRPVCQAPCDLACSAGEECYYPLPGVPGCRAIETFDAGTLKFVGTTVPITLYPPYVLPAGVTGPLLLPGEEVSVKASGASGAGFEAFEATMVASEPIITDLETLTTGKAFGPQEMPLTWVAGEQEGVVRVSVQITNTLGTGGFVQCEAPDTGSFAVPRAAINSAIGEDDPSSMAITLERRTSTITPGVATKGELVDATVQPMGVVELVSASAVTSSVAACPTGQSACGADDACISTDYDELNCGGCGIECDAGQTCNLGECMTPGTCCATTTTPGCTASPTIEQCVCDVYSSCCTSSWSSTCVSYITTYGCGVC